MVDVDIHEWTFTMKINLIKFDSPLSETEVRMTLKELCGSKLYDYPFRGKVNDNSFNFIRNSFANTSLTATVTGNFYKQDDNTKINLFLEIKMINIIGILIFVFLFYLVAAFGFVSMLKEGIIIAIISFVIISSFGPLFLALNFLFQWLRYKRAVSIIKKELIK